MLGQHLTRDPSHRANSDNTRLSGVTQRPMKVTRLTMSANGRLDIIPNQT